MSTSLAFNRDCMEAMREFPDAYFDLAVVDPPYGDGCLQSLNVERERERRTDAQRGTGSDSGLTATNKVSRTGGTWAEKYAKKLSRGTLPQEKIISKSFSASHGIKSFGAATTSPFPPHGAFSFGAS